MRPPAAVDGSFLRLKEGKTLASYPTLAQALARADDGETIEIRGDGPFEGGYYHGRSAPHHLKIRAAPGYRPVITSSLVVRENCAVSLEGLCFRNANVASESDGTLIRAANCAWEGAIPRSRSLSQLRAGNRPQKAVEIVSCLAPETLLLSAPPDAHLVVRNSVVGPLSLPWKGKAAPLTVDIDHSVVLDPRDARIAIMGTQGQLMTVKSQDSVFDFTKYFALGDHWSTPHIKLPVNWHGERNVYRTGASEWFPRGERTHEEVAGIAALKSNWNSPETGSITADPMSAAPRLWRLEPERPELSSYGADLSRIPQFPIRVHSTNTEQEPPKELK